MQAFPVHTIESAPEQSRPSLDILQEAFGMIPNIARAMSTSPVLIGSLVALFQKVHGGHFSEAQIQILLLTNAVTNACAPAVTTVGTPQTIAAQELRVECMYPADDATEVFHAKPLAAAATRH
jgi:hypothetical protein